MLLSLSDVVIIMLVIVGLPRPVHLIKGLISRWPFGLTSKSYIMIFLMKRHI